MERQTDSHAEYPSNETILTSLCLRYLLFVVLSILKPSAMHFSSKIIIVYIYLHFPGRGNAIKCFKCAVTIEKIYSYAKNATSFTPLCSKFDESDEYIVECPYSTMCLKTISTLYLQNNQQQTTATRGCAPQKDTKQVCFEFLVLLGLYMEQFALIVLGL